MNTRRIARSRLPERWRLFHRPFASRAHPTTPGADVDAPIPELINELRLRRIASSWGSVRDAAGDDPLRLGVGAAYFQAAATADREDLEQALMATSPGRLHRIRTRLARLGRPRLGSHARREEPVSPGQPE